MPRVKGSITGSVAKAKAGATSGGFLISYVKTDQPMVVRFLTEPDEWFGYNEHYDQNLGYYPCVEDSELCPGCKEGERTSYRYLANVLNREDDKVIALKLPRDLANRVLMKNDKYDTIMDRDYELAREGKGRDDTMYDVTPESPSRIRLSKYEDQLHDLEQVASDEWDRVFAEKTAEEDEDDEDRPRRRVRRSKSASKTRSKASKTPTRRASRPTRVAKKAPSRRRRPRR